MIKASIILICLVVATGANSTVTNTTAITTVTTSTTATTTVTTNTTATTTVITTTKESEHNDCPRKIDSCITSDCTVVKCDAIFTCSACGGRMMRSTCVKKNIWVPSVMCPRDFLLPKNAYSGSEVMHSTGYSSFVVSFDLKMMELPSQIWWEINEMRSLLYENDCHERNTTFGNFDCKVNSNTSLLTTFRFEPLRKPMLVRIQSNSDLLASMYVEVKDCPPTFERNCIVQKPCFKHGCKVPVKCSSCEGEAECLANARWKLEGCAEKKPLEVNHPVVSTRVGSTVIDACGSLRCVWVILICVGLAGIIVATVIYVYPRREQIKSDFIQIRNYRKVRKERGRKSIQALEDLEPDKLRPGDLFAQEDNMGGTPM